MKLLSALIIIVVAGSLGVVSTMANFSDSEEVGGSLQASSLDLQLRCCGGGWSDGLSEVWDLPLSAGGDDVWSSLQLRNVGSIGEWVDIDCDNANAEPGDDLSQENERENRLLTATEIGVDDDGDGAIDEDDIDGVDNDSDGLVDEDPSNAGIGFDDDYDGAIDEDAIDGIDNDSDGLVDEDPPSADGGIPATAGRGIYDKDRWLEIAVMDYTYYDGTTWVTIDLLDYPTVPQSISDADGDGRVSLNDLEILGIQGLPAPLPGGSDTTQLDMTIRLAFGVGNEYQGDMTNMTLIFTLR